MLRKNRIYFTPVLFFLLMLIDGQLTWASEALTDGAYLASAHLMLLGFMMGTQCFSKRYLLITAIILGMIGDSYYLGIIGIYTVALTVTVMLMFTFIRVTHMNLLTGFFGMIIFVTIYELIAVGLQVVFQLSNVMPTVFITKVLGPSLLFNMLIYVVFSYPFKRLFTN